MTTVLADEAPLLIDQRLVATLRTFLSLSHCAVDNVFLECPLHTILPGIDALALELQRTDQFDDMFDGHPVAQHPRDEFGVVPILGVEFLAQALHRGFVATLVFKLEVIAVAAILVGLLDDFALRHCFRKDDTLVVVLKTGKYLIGIAMEQAHESHPFLLVVLEPHHVALKDLWPHLSDLGVYRTVLFWFRLLLLFLVYSHHHTSTAAVAIDGTALAARPPCLDIEFVYQFFIHVVGKVDGHADRMVDPFLYPALHLHFHQPVYVIGSSLKIGRPCHELVDFLLAVALLGIQSVDLHPLEEFGMIDDILLERIAHIVDEIHMYVGIAGVDLATAFVDRHEDRLYATGGLRHQAGGACRCYGKASDVATPILHHIVVKFGGSLLDTPHKRIVLLALGIVDLESPTLLCHRYR